MKRVLDRVTRPSGILAAATSLGVLILVAATVLGVRSAQPVSTTEIQSIAERAIVIANTATELPNELKPGHFLDSERASLRGRITQDLMSTFADGALTGRMNGYLAWVDRIAKDPTQPRTLSFSLVSLSMDPPAVLYDVATVTGTYVMSAKQAYNTGGGITATYGGTYTNAFTLQIEHLGSAWFVTAYSEQPIAFVPNASFESNLDVNPAPDATKSPTDNPPIQLNPVGP